MHIFDFPLEILEQLFYDFVASRSFKRVMRLRLVSRDFRFYTNEAIFRAGLLHNPSPPLKVTFRTSASFFRPWITFTQQEIVHRIMRNKDLEAREDELLQAAKKYGELTGQAGEAWLRSCLADLIAVESMIPGNLKYFLRQQFIHMPELHSLQSDVLNAALCMDNLPLVRRLLVENPSLGWCDPAPSGLSYPNTRLLFRLQIVAHKCNLEAIKILIAADPNLAKLSGLPRILQYWMLSSTAGGIKKQSQVVDFLLNMRIPWNHELDTHENIKVPRRKALRETPCVDDFEKLAIMLGLKGRDWWLPEMKEYFQFRLSHSAALGQVEMVRYCLKEGANPNAPIEMHGRPHDPHHDLFPNERYAPLMLAVERGETEIVRILLDSGADLHRFNQFRNPLMLAVHRGHLQIVRLLLDAGANINEGSPPPIALAVRNENTHLFHYLKENGADWDAEGKAWAMTFARLQGLDSMIDLLTTEGVEKNVFMSWVGAEEELFSCFEREEKTFYEDTMQYFILRKDSLP